MKNDKEVKEKVTKKGATTKGKNTKKNVETQKKQTNKNVAKKKNDNNKIVAKTKVGEKVVEEVIIEEVKEEKVGERKKTKTTNKKSDIFLILGLVVVVVLGFLLMSDKDAGPSYELPLTLSGEAGLHQLTYQEYQEKIDNGEEFVIILERATCSHCVTYMPIAEQFAQDNGVPIYYVDTDTFTSEDWTGFEKSISYLRKSNGNWGTPTTLVQAGSETVDYIEGSTNAENLLDLYDKYFEMGE